MVALAATIPLTLHAVPEHISFEGQLQVDGVDFDGDGLFKFIIYDDAHTILWTNDGSTLADVSTVPTAAVTVAVSGGRYSVFLGDASLTNMTPLPDTAFTADSTNLRTWFSDGTTGFELLSPDQPIDIAPYAAAPDGHSLAAADTTLPEALVVNKDVNLGIGATNPVLELDGNGADDAADLKINGVDVGASSHSFGNSGTGGMRSTNALLTTSGTGVLGSTNRVVEIHASNDTDLRLLKVVLTFDTDSLIIPEVDGVQKVGRTTSNDSSFISLAQEGSQYVISIQDFFGGTAVPVGDGPVLQLSISVAADATTGDLPIQFIQAQTVTTPTITFDGFTDSLFTVTAPPVQDWQLTIDVSGAGTAQLILGMQGVATDGIDSGIDLDAPSSPSAYFVTDGTDLRTDYRGLLDTSDWHLVTAADGDALILTWDKTTIPANHYLSLIEVDATGIPIEGLSTIMNVVEQLTVETGTIRYFTLQFDFSARSPLSLAPGWNFVSLPLTPHETSPSSLFVDPTTSAPLLLGNSWNYGGDQYDEVTAIEALVGYWLYAKDPATLLIDGVPIEPDSNDNVLVPLAGGWNMFGPIDTVTVPTTLTAPLEGMLWEWDGENFRRANSMMPRNAYWIKAVDRHRPAARPHDPGSHYPIGAISIE